MKKFFLICMVTVWILFAFSNCFALTKLYEKSSSQIINSGTKLTKYTRLTDKGWLAINIIEVDLKDDNTTVRTLTSENGLQTFQNVKTMLTNEEHCIAAVNADFFTGNYKRGNIIGLTIKDGKMLTSTYYENEIKDTMASFYIDDQNDAAFDYFSNQITLENLSHHDSMMISEINKWSSNYEYPVVYTLEWGTTPGLSFGSALTEMVVQNGVVKEFREGKEAIPVPENGFVVTTVGATAEKLHSIFSVGDKVKLHTELDIDIEKVKMAISGGSLLVSHGKVADFTHTIYGTNPRTAIGLSKDGSKMYLITIDGRQKQSVGVTQAELAEILVEKGIYTAMNFDGGGSTTMVARELGESEATVENSPSEGTLRMVPNAVGVFNTEKTGTLKNLVVEVLEPNVFVGCEKELIVKGYDEYYNPVDVREEKIKWAYEGVDVSVKDLVLHAGNEAGSVTVTASIGKAKGSVTMDVLSAPNELTISPKKVTVAKGESVAFEVSGQNKNGYYASLKNSEVTWKVENGNAHIHDGVFASDSEGSYLISVSSGGATSYAVVEVLYGSECYFTEGFERLNFTFKNYPEEVKGKVDVSNEEVFVGKRSAKLTYDFTGTNQTRAAYLRFDEPIGLNENAEKMKVMCYATSSSDKVKAKITDVNGEVQYVTLANSIEAGDWKELTFNLSNIALPAILTDLYIVQENQDELTSGSVFFDGLEVWSRKKGTIDNTVVLPKDVKGVDELNVYSDLETSDAFRVVVSPELYGGILLEQLKNKKVENLINKNAEMVIYPYRNFEEMLGNVSKEKVVGNAYSVKQHGNLSVISVNVAEGGIRTSDSEQWISLQSDIKNGKKNILVVLNGNLDDFTDSAEKQLLIDVLCDLRRSTGKNIWVIQTGDYTDYSMKRGVKFLTIHSKKFDEDTTWEDIKNMNYIMITVNQDKMTYEIKKVFEK